jgi:nitrate/TMAO reductase-like tetraheme cytochrome c subunit
MFDRIKGWATLWRIPKRWWLLGIPAGGFLAFVVGILFWGSFNTAMEMSNTEEFCISCHEMREFVYPDYTEAPHYSNASGVRAICADCHVPQAFGPKLLKKIEASRELWHHLLGTIDTEEAFEAHRYEMAERVWEYMRETDSRECRNCHSREAMALDLQGRQAQRKHSDEWYERTGETCIDCHQGIAHPLPTPPAAEEEPAP